VKVKITFALEADLLASGAGTKNSADEALSSGKVDTLV
jgi:hypothetical protein